MSKLYNVIAELCDRQGINISELCRRSGVNRGSLGDIKTGRRQSLSAENLKKIADYFGVSIDYLLGNSPAPRTSGVRVPVYGQIAAGIPIEAITDIEDYEEISEEMAKSGEYLGLRIHGDSMEPRFTEGDVIIVRQQDTCENGDICAVLVNGNDATCKKIKRTPEGILLISANPKYDPMFYTNRQIAELPVRILGKVVELRAKF